jgi:hypothetical protein
VLFVTFGLWGSPFINDFSNAARLDRNMESIGDHVDRFGFAMCDAASDEIITDQKGVFRTNCLDWLVRLSFFFFPPFLFSWLSSRSKS